MKSTQTFCSACDRPVRVMISEGPAHGAHATIHDEEVVCLEIGSQCTGQMCPIGAAAPDAMVARIVRHGLPTDGLRTVTALCPACGDETEMVLYGDGKAACTICGSPARWSVDHAEPVE